MKTLVVLIVLGQLVGNVAQSQDATRSEVQWLGKRSCASATCHGNRIDQGPKWNHSLTTFTTQDPHAQAGMILLDPSSQQIVSLLSPSVQPETAEYDRVLRDRCIGCHTSVTNQAMTGLIGRSDAPLPKNLLSDGVSCESCHGPAGDWIDEHLRISFRGASRFVETSFRDTESIIGRTDICAPCHVGSRLTDGIVRDMNHDLIAAGHPALRFDMLTYNDNLPKHWNEKATDPFTQSKIRVRKASGAALQAAALELARERADASVRETTVPWPELSEFDCFSCHQPIRAHSPNTNLTGISDGQVNWSTLHRRASRTSMGETNALPPPTRWKQTFESIRHLGPILAKQSRSQAESLEKQSFDAMEEIQSCVERCLTDEKLDWHTAAVIYLDLSAAIADAKRVGLTDDSTTLTDEGLQRLEYSLRFAPADETDARSPDDLWLISPANYQPQAFRQVMLEHFQPLPNTR